MGLRIATGTDQSKGLAPGVWHTAIPFAQAATKFIGSRRILLARGVHPTLIDHSTHSTCDERAAHRGVLTGNFPVSSLMRDFR